MKSQLPAVFNWSGGKDSTLALHKILLEGQFDVRYLLTTVNDLYGRVSMHGVRESLLIQQAESIGIPLYQVRLSDSPEIGEYERQMRDHLTRLKSEGIAHSIFGDIFLEDLRAYRENRLSEIGMTGIFPLWKQNTGEILQEFLDLGYKTVVVCARAGLQEFCGRVIDGDFIKELPKEVDPCGENGEFHTFVIDGPIFKHPVPFTLGEKIFRTFPSPSVDQEAPSGYWYIDLMDA